MPDLTTAEALAYILIPPIIYIAFQAGKAYEKGGKDRMHMEIGEILWGAVIVWAIVGSALWAIADLIL